MKATEIARRLNRDASMVSRLCANYEADRDLMTEKQTYRSITVYLGFSQTHE
jgi:hypothetical protein